jgi:hypothetical protein
VRYLMTTMGGQKAPDQQLFADMAEFIAELTQAGVVVATGGLDLEGTHVTARNGAATFTDGPYADSKETVVSFAVVDVASKEEALEISRRFWALVGDGEGDIRQVFGPGE